MPHGLRDATRNAGYLGRQVWTQRGMPHGLRDAGLSFLIGMVLLFRPKG